MKAPSTTVTRVSAAALAAGSLLTGTALLAHPASGSTTTSITDNADAWVTASSPSTNYGAAHYLQIDNSPTLRGYLRFTISVPAGSSVGSAVLSVLPNQSNSGGFTVHTASSSWTESGITYSNAPAQGTTSYASSGAVTAGSWKSVDVTHAIPASGGTITLVLDNATAASYSLKSKEYGSSYAPRLAVTLNSSTTTPTPTPTTSPTSSPTATPTTSPTSSPTTSPTSSPTTSPTSSGTKLTWRPPAMVNPVTYHVSGDGPGTITAAAGQDSYVVWDGPTDRRIRFSGGHNWVIIGGEVNNNKQWSSEDDQAGIQFDNVNGTAYVEGMYIHGPYGRDGIRVGSGGSNTTLIVQNSRIIDRLSGPNGYHADVIQPFGGVKAYDVDHLTGMSDFQGQMWKQESGTYFGPSDFRNVNYHADSPEHQYMINFVMANATQPVTLTNVFNQPDPNFVGGNFCAAQTPSGSATCGTDSSGRKYVTWSGTPIVINGRITQGPPPNGDFVPSGAAGMNYRSPGYL